MRDNGSTDDYLNRPHLASVASRLSPELHIQEDTEEQEACAAFGFLRGVRDRALAVEFRYRNGNSDWFSYNLLGSWRFNPSVGLLLRFTGDVVNLVLIRGSNLDVGLTKGGMNLTDQGFQRHRVLWVREMDEGELRATGAKGPTIDRIEVGEFDSHEELTTWLGKYAPVFLR